MAIFEKRAASTGIARDCLVFPANHAGIGRDPQTSVACGQQITDLKGGDPLSMRRPRSSVLHFARLMGKKYAGTPLAKYFITGEV